jgi:tetratricopeptide (TPR) repeat protein
MAAMDKQILKTSKGHQWLTLIGATFVIFEIVFIVFYSNNFWFSLDLANFGLPAILAAAVLAYGVLRLLELPLACKLAQPVFKGKPPIIYRTWLKLDEDGFTHGMRHVRFAVIDAVELTLFGNLVIRSRAICGNESQQPDLIFKFPFASAAQVEQRRFAEALKVACPAVVMNKRLKKNINSPIVRGQNLIQFIGAGMMLVLLLDLGYSSSYYLEMLKHYYLADTDALAHNLADADVELKTADNLRVHPLPLSYITTRFLNVGSCASGVSSARAEALWHMGRKDDALAEAQRTIEASPENFRGYLHYARLLEDSGKLSEAQAQIEEAVEKHKDSLLPRLYLMANAHDQRAELVPMVYKQAMDDLNDKVFQDEPVWPPGGNSFVHDVFYSNDIYFVLDRLLKAPETEPAPRSSSARIKLNSRN